MTRHLCSYYGKTIIFWLIEEKPRTFWNDSLVEILKVILYKLRQFLIAKSCPNYFIPQNHMFDHFTDVEASTLWQRLDEVEYQFWKTFLVVHLSSIYFKMIFLNREFLLSLCKFFIFCTGSIYQCASLWKWELTL